MADPVLLRDGGIADLDAMMQVMEDSFDPVFGEAWTAPQCAGLMPLPGVWLTLAFAAEAPVGFSLARVVAGEAELLLLAVKSAAQRQGTGKLLLNRFVRVAKDRGASRFHLEVRDGNHAVKLYEAAGFSLAGRRKNYYNGRDGQLYDALTLAKNDVG